MCCLGLYQSLLTYDLQEGFMKLVTKKSLVNQLRQVIILWSNYFY